MSNFDQITTVAEILCDIDNNIYHRLESISKTIQMMSLCDPCDLLDLLSEYLSDIKIDIEDIHKQLVRLK